MKPLIAALALAAACAAAAAAGAAGDPLHSERCQAARAQLERLLDEPPARRGARLAQARRDTAEACLGKAVGTPQRSGAPEPPLAVPPAIVGAPRTMAPPAVAPPPPPLAIPRPTAITSCDPAGCWDSEGRRLNQTGPFLVGPGGVCTAQGGLVACP